MLQRVESLQRQRKFQGGEQHCPSYVSLFVKLIGIICGRGNNGKIPNLSKECFLMVKVLYAQVSKMGKIKYREESKSGFIQK